jgi:uncharacterized heparinase superfamily protein
MKSASKKLPRGLLDKVRRGVESVAYGNPIYQKILKAGEETPDCLHFTLPDTWPGDAEAGLALMSAQGALFDRPSPPRHAMALRNLRAVGTDSARKMALSIIENWLARFDQWNDVEWSPDVTGERIGAWIGFYEFYAPVATEDFVSRLTESLHRQYKHLLRTVSGHLTGIAGLRVIKGLVLSGLNFDETDRALSLACELLSRQLATEILSDGGVISRSPSVQLHTARHLIDLRAIFKAAGIEAPAILPTTINAIIPALKLFRHGDGGLALFHGSTEETSLLVEAALTQSEVKARVPRRLAAMGYERLIAGRSMLIADCGAPPPHGHDAFGHAGLLSFEFGQGRERMIVNCGEVEGAAGDWRVACAATAAHSTLTVEDTNACEVLDRGGIISAAHVTTQRFEQDGAHCVEMTHNGYRPVFGIMHQRRLGLTADGDELYGTETLSGPPGRAFTLRWHLHPSIQVSLAHSGQTALLRLPSGSGWRLRAEPHDLSLEHSIYCGNGTPRRNTQLKLSGFTQTPTTELKWSLVRERKN